MKIIINFVAAFGVAWCWLVLVGVFCGCCWYVLVVVVVVVGKLPNKYKRAYIVAHICLHVYMYVCAFSKIVMLHVAHALWLLSISSGFKLPALPPSTMFAYMYVFEFLQHCALLLLCACLEGFIVY